MNTDNEENVLFECEIWGLDIMKNFTATALAIVLCVVLILLGVSAVLGCVWIVKYLAMALR